MGPSVTGGLIRKIRSKMRKIKRIGVILVALCVLALSGITLPAYANESFSMSPMTESVILNPGDSYSSSFNITNTSSDGDFHYNVSVIPYYVDETHSAIFENENDRSRIVDWITINGGNKGKLATNETKTIEFTVSVPETAAAGGQYACIVVEADSEFASSDAGEGGGIDISEGFRIGYTFFAEITGESIISGEIVETAIPSVVVDGKISATSIVKNTGNVHSVAKYRLLVYPLFSDTPAYDSDEHTVEVSDTHIIFPEREYVHEMHWEDTPILGIYNVKYKIEYQGLENETTGVVLVCPGWLIFLTLIGLVILVIRIISLMKIRKIGKEMDELKKEQKP